MGFFNYMPIGYQAATDNKPYSYFDRDQHVWNVILSFVKWKNDVKSDPIFSECQIHCLSKLD